MRMNLDEIVRCVADILLARDDVHDLSIPSGKDSQGFYYEGGPKMLDDRCIFDNCTEKVKTDLLEFYFSQRGLQVSFNWDVNVEFAKLAAKYGKLVARKADGFFPSDFTNEWGTYFLHMAYFGSSEKYEPELVRLIEISPEDGRDGLFIGSWFSQSELVQRTLIKAFCKWVKTPSWDAATGEMFALRYFLRKWEMTVDRRKETEQRARIEKEVSVNHDKAKLENDLKELRKMCRKAL